MCGLAGALSFSGKIHHERLDALVQVMSDKMIKRGPDAFSIWSNHKNISFSHRRLSILDLDSRSNQPMQSDDNRYTIVFNGEIYNYLELRSQLQSKGHKFKTSGDTEVILKLFETEKETMLGRLQGMFAIAIWDNVKEELFLARDPYGIKPLYYFLDNDLAMFSSQVKAIIATKEVSLKPSFYGQAGYWLLGSVPEPYTWFDEIKSVPAGCYGYLNKFESLHFKKYLDISSAWINADKSEMSSDEIQNLIAESVSKSVKKHLVSDVPVGLFLSGGIDSSAIAGHVQDLGFNQLNGVTISFDEFKNNHADESPVAKRIADLYGFKHHIYKVQYQEFENDLSDIFNSMDQPTIDGVNTWYASKAISKLGLKVVLSGVGGDELFYGYPSFKQVPKLLNTISCLNQLPFMLKLAQTVFNYQAARSKNKKWNYISQQAKNIYGSYWIKRGLHTPDDITTLMSKNFTEDQVMEIRPDEMINHFVGDLNSTSDSDVAVMESKLYLRNQLLKDSDWASMAHSVELRTPLVDSKLLFDLSPAIKSFAKFKPKVMLARSSKNKLPDDIIFRKKTGFGIPLGSWLSRMKSEKSSVVNQSAAESRAWSEFVAENIYKN